MKVPKQPEVNIGLVGHVDHGKTTLTKAFSGEWTDRHSEEIKRGISIRLGYADTALYKCQSCPPPQCYGVSPTCGECGGGSELLRTVSFVDAPGHETLMATMISGAAIMNGSLLLIAANETCPQPQTKEHLMALDICGIDNVIIVQNKIDLLDDEALLKNYEEIKKFAKGTIAENAPIIPISAHHDVNIDVLIQAIEEKIPTPDLDDSKPPRMYIARSFDVNKPGLHADDLLGGVLGGSLLQGVMNNGDEIEIRPGRRVEEKGKIFYEPILTEVAELITGGRKYKKIKPGGLIGISTHLDPMLTKSDSLTGNVCGHPDTLPPVWEDLRMENHLVEHVVGSSEDTKVEEIRTNEPLMLNAGTATTVGIVTSAQKDFTELTLKLPICMEKGDRVSIARKVGGRWRLIGYGIIT